MNVEMICASQHSSTRFFPSKAVAMIFALGNCPRTYSSSSASTSRNTTFCIHGSIAYGRRIWINGPRTVRNRSAYADTASQLKIQPRENRVTPTRSELMIHPWKVKRGFISIVSRYETHGILQEHDVYISASLQNHMLIFWTSFLARGRTLPTPAPAPRATA